VRRVLDSAHGAIGQAQADIRVGLLPPISGDPAAIEQIFSNLIGNALHYRDPERPLRIDIDGGAGADGRSVVYRVKDTGLGIPESALPKLFTAFRRFHPDAAPGEGVGLAMVRRIVERQHGSIRAESTLGKGSTFIVELPNEASLES
jgi:signal transduction histidine kinase